MLDLAPCLVGSADRKNREYAPPPRRSIWGPSIKPKTKFGKKNAIAFFFKLSFSIKRFSKLGLLRGHSLKRVSVKGTQPFSRHSTSWASRKNWQKHGNFWYTSTPVLHGVNHSSYEGAIEYWSCVFGNFPIKHKAGFYSEKNTMQWI